MPSLQEHMRKFSSLQKLDISFNPALECKGVVAILTSLSGKDFVRSTVSVITVTSRSSDRKD
jgi:hypothetical protein